MPFGDWRSTGAAWWPEVSPQSHWDLDTACPSSAQSLQRSLLISLSACYLNVPPLRNQQYDTSESLLKTDSARVRCFSPPLCNERVES